MPQTATIMAPLPSGEWQHQIVTNKMIAAILADPESFDLNVDIFSVLTAYWKVLGSTAPLGMSSEQFDELSHQTPLQRKEACLLFVSGVRRGEASFGKHVGQSVRSVAALLGGLAYENEKAAQRLTNTALERHEEPFKKEKELKALGEKVDFLTAEIRKMRDITRNALARDPLKETKESQ